MSTRHTGDSHSTETRPEQGETQAAFLAFALDTEFGPWCPVLRVSTGRGKASSRLTREGGGQAWSQPPAEAAPLLATSRAAPRALYKSLLQGSAHDL